MRAGGTGLQGSPDQGPGRAGERCGRHGANARGGVILVGVAEVKGCASKLLSVPADDAEFRRIRQAVATRVARVPSYDLHPILDEDGSTYYAVIIESTSMGPHAVVDPNTKTLLYPVRDGTTTRYMGEAEIASRYRDRFARAAALADRLEQVLAEGSEHLVTAGRSWLTLALVPDVPGHLRIGKAALDDHYAFSERWQASHSPQSHLNLTGVRSQTVGFRRLIISNDLNYHGSSTYGHHELHHDGSCFSAVNIGGPPQRPAQVAPEDEDRDHYVDQGDLALAVSSRDVGDSGVLVLK